MKRKIFSWTLVVLWMALIFYFSHQPAIESNELSTGLTSKIADMINKIAPNIGIDQGSLNHIIRKGAHFGVYSILGLLVANGLFDGNRSKLSLILIALLICVLYAISDEIHQLFIPGRSGEIRDVLLDGAGALAGIMLMTQVRKFDNRID